MPRQEARGRGQQLGYRVFRVSNDDDVYNNLDGALDALLAFIEAPALRGQSPLLPLAPSLFPSPSGPLPRGRHSWVARGRRREGGARPRGYSTVQGHTTPSATARPAARPEKRHPPRKVPSSARYPCMPPPPNPATSPAA